MCLPKKELIKELPSLGKGNPSALTLHVAVDKAGKELGAALDGTDALADALLEPAHLHARTRFAS